MNILCTEGTLRRYHKKLWPGQREQDYSTVRSWRSPEPNDFGRVGIE